MKIFGNILIVFSTVVCFQFCDSTRPDDPIRVDFGPINKILIIGNSITQAQPFPDKGWFGSWGMAASDSTKDYVHILIDSIHMYNPLAEIVYTGKGALFEREFLTYNLDASYHAFKEFEPDLVIFRFGENVNDFLARTENFETYFEEFTSYFMKKEKMPILVVTSIWEQTHSTKAMKKVANSNNYFYIDLRPYATSENLAKEEYEDKEVGAHPNNLGMKRIAVRIWNEIHWLFKEEN